MKSTRIADRRAHAWPKAAKAARIGKIGDDDIDMTPAFGVREICSRRGPYTVVLTCPSQRRLTSKAGRVLNRLLGWKTKSIAAEER